VPLINDHAQLPPSGDFDFTDAGVTLRSKSLKNLLQDIARFRSNNAMPPGNPASEVEAYYCDAYPWLVTKVGEPPAPVEDPVARWLNRIWALAPRSFLDSIPAQMRYEVCLKCEFYQEEHAYDTEATRRLMILGAGRTTGRGICEVHHWSIPLAVLIEKPDAAMKVEGCWASPVV
jgi:hypothetical protein